MKKRANIDYQQLLDHSDDQPSKCTINTELLHAITRQLNKKQIQTIADALETERAHFARSSTPGHKLWYPIKLANCARFQALTKTR